jgi:hypothetical protein
VDERCNFPGAGTLASEISTVAQRTKVKWSEIQVVGYFDFISWAGWIPSTTSQDQ